MSLSVKKVLQSCLVFIICCFAILTCGATVKAQENVDIFRLYNSTSGEHLYTPAPSEVSNLVRNGWSSEGIGWKAPGAGDPVYRLYNPSIGTHLYTMSPDEISHLTSNNEWVMDFSGQPAFYSGGSIPIYRVYLDVMKRHHLTTDVDEYNTLPNFSWTQEGVALYAVSSGDQSETPDVPVDPGNTGTPNTPNNPGSSDNSGTPSTPGNSDNAGTPSTPSNPNDPGTPDNPTTPDNPNTQVDVGAYNSIIQKYIEALPSKNYNSKEMGSFYADAFPGEPGVLDATGYCLYDINKDEIPELCVGPVGGTTFTAIYSLSDNAPVLSAVYTEDSADGGMAITGDVPGDSLASNCVQYINDFGGSKTLLYKLERATTRFSVSYYQDPNTNSWYRSTDENNLKAEKVDQVPSEVGMAGAIKLPFTPFSQFSPIS